MKRAAAFVCALLLLLGSCFIVCAQESAQISLEVDNVKSNRLFDISVCAQCSSAISGGEFELTYDSSVVEYRDVSSGCFEVRAKDYGDKLYIVFATSDSMSSSDATEIVSVRFKSIAQGEFDTQLKVTECIDDKLKPISAQPSSATITVEKDTVTATSKSNSENTTTHKSSVKKSQAIQSDESVTNSGYSAMSVESNLDSNKAIWYGVCAGLVVILAFALGMMFRKKADSNSDTQDKNE